MTHLHTILYSEGDTRLERVGFSDTLASNELLSRTESLRGKQIAKSKYCD